MTGDPLSDRWLQWLVDERNVSDSTIRARRSVLRQIGNAGVATEDDLEAWWATRRHLSRSTRNSELSHVRVFYKWLKKHRLRKDDPSELLEAPRMPKGLPHPINRSDLNLLLAELPPDLRRAACLGAWAGLRVSEAAALDWRDIDADGRRIRVESSKGLRTRVVGMHPVLLDSLLPNTGGNVITGGGKPYSADVLSRKINRAMRRHGLTLTYHALRHRYATVALADVGNLLAVSRALGHSSPATTAIYAELADTDLDKIAAAVVR